MAFLITLITLIQKNSRNNNIKPNTNNNISTHTDESAHNYAATNASISRSSSSAC